MREFVFEIVRSRFGRYSWLLVELDGGRRRVLLRAERDYRSRRRVEKAICRLQEIVAGAAVVDATRSDDDAFPLPNRYFSLDPDLVPLVVDESPVDLPQPRTRRRRRAVARSGATRPEGRAAEDTGSGTKKGRSRSRAT